MKQILFILIIIGCNINCPFVDHKCTWTIKGFGGYNDAQFIYGVKCIHGHEKTYPTIVNYDQGDTFNEVLQIKKCNK